MNVLCRRAAPLALSCFLLVSLAGCQGKWIVSPEANATAESPKKKAPRHSNDGHRVAVVAGPAYASDVTGASGAAAGDSIFGELVEEYGLVADGGMLVFAKNVDAIRGDPSVSLVITVGAPERTARDLDRLRAAMPKIRIVTLFPTDEVLSVEAVSDLVIDIPVSTELLADENAQSASSVPRSELSFLLLAAALYADRGPEESPAVRFDAAIVDARIAARLPGGGNGWQIAHFIDTDTGLKARNHFILDIPGDTP